MKMERCVMEQVTYQKDEVIFNEGEDGLVMYKVLDGVVGVYTNFGRENQSMLTELRQGAYLGEMAVIEIEPRSATAVALADDTRLQVIQGERLLNYLLRNENELDSILRHLSSRLRNLTKDYGEVCATLRELGRLDTRGEKVSESLMDKVKKFASVYFKRKSAADRAGTLSAEEPEQSGHADGFVKKQKTFDKGAVIFRSGDKGDCMYDIHTGRVGIYADYGQPSQKLLTELVPNHFFGEMGLLEKLPRSATAVAMEDDTEVELIYEGDVFELFERNSAKILMLLRHLSYRLRRLTLDYLKACKTLAEARSSIEQSGDELSAETRAQIEYLHQVMILPEIVY